MKKLFILVLGSFFLFSAPAFSQVDFADLNEDTTKKVIDKGVFDNAGYFKAGISIPVGKFGKAPSIHFTAFDSFNGVDGSGGQTGLAFEVGLIYYIHEIPLPKQFRVGLDMGLAVATNDLDWNTLDKNFKTNSTRNFLFFKEVKKHGFAGVKVGPAISYHIKGNLIADFSFKLNPCFSNGLDISYNEVQGITYSEWQSKDDYYSYRLSTKEDKTFSLRKSLGLNVRYNALVLGLEYNFGKVGYTLTESFDTRTGPGINCPNCIPETQSGEKTVKVNTPTSMLLWTIGLKF